MRTLMVSVVMLAVSTVFGAEYIAADFAELEALIDGGSLARGDTVALTGKRYDFTSPLTLPKDELTIRGACGGGVRPVLSGGGVSSGFFASSGSVFRDLVFTNFTSSATAGGPDHWGTALRASKCERFVITNCLFTHCFTPASGGAVAVHKADIYDSAFVSNTAYCTYSGAETEGTGGGALGVFLNNGYGRVRITGCRFEGNTCTPPSGNGSGGGAITAPKHNLYLTNTVFIGNSSTCHAGAVYGNPASASNVTFTANTASARGGAIGSVNPGAMKSVYVDCVFTVNSATDGQGGAIYQHNAAAGGLTATNCTFTGNSAKTSGGAIDCDERYVNALV